MIVFKLDDDLSCTEAASLAEAAEYLKLKPLGHVEKHCMHIIARKMSPQLVWEMLDESFRGSIQNKIDELCLSVRFFIYNFFATLVSMIIFFLRRLKTIQQSASITSRLSKPYPRVLIKC